MEGGDDVWMGAGMVGRWGGESGGAQDSCRDCVLTLSSETPMCASRYSGVHCTVFCADGEYKYNQAAVVSYVR